MNDRCEELLIVGVNKIILVRPDDGFDINLYDKRRKVYESNGYDADSG